MLCRNTRSVHRSQAHNHLHATPRRPHAPAGLVLVLRIFVAEIDRNIMSDGRLSVFQLRDPFVPATVLI